MDASHVYGFPTDVAAILRYEKRHIEVLLDRLQSGQMTPTEINMEIKNAERVLRCLRYSRGA